MVVLDYELAAGLFGAKPALGMQVQFQGSYFQVIGVTTPRRGEGLTVTVGPSENIAYMHNELRSTLDNVESHLVSHMP